MKYLEFERAVKRRILNRHDVAEHSIAILLFAGAACFLMMAGIAVLWFVERLGACLL